MDNHSPEGGDVLGIRPLGKAIDRLSEAAVSAAGAFLSRICLPAAEELGFLLQDNVRGWRARNATRIAQKAEEITNARAGQSPLRAPPRIVAAALEVGSWTDDDHLQSMWAGLLASSCTPEGGDEENLMFTSLLGQLSSSQVRILEFACINCQKHTEGPGFVLATLFTMSVDQLRVASSVQDIHRLDRELDHLHELGLIGGMLGPVGFLAGPNGVAAVTPTALALHMYVRCKGSRQSPSEFFGVAPPSTPPS